LRLFDPDSLGWLGDATDVLWEGPNPAGQGVVAMRRRADLWLRVGEFLSSDRLLLSDALAVALHELAGLYAANERTSTKVLDEVRRFVRYTNACGIDACCRRRNSFVDSRQRARVVISFVRRLNGDSGFGVQSR
jgi:hypothetical protein